MLRAASLTSGRIGVPIELDPRCRARLVEIIADNLPAVRVRQNRVIEFSSIWPLRKADNALPRQARDELSEYIGDLPLFDFAYEHIRDRLPALPYSDNDRQSPAIDLLAITDPSSFAREIVDLLCTLPWTYVLSLRLNGTLEMMLRDLLNQEGQSISIGPRLRLLGPAADHLRSLPREGIGFAEPEDDAAVFLAIKAYGFIARYDTTVTFLRAISDLKSFAGLGMALELFDNRRSVTSSEPATIIGQLLAGRDIGQRKSTITVHLASADNLKYISRKEIPLEAAGLFDRLSIPNPRYIKGLFTILSTASMVEGARKLRLAGEWLFDSYASENDTLAFVQAMVVLEILFGDRKQSEKIGIERLIANRCAYLVGKSAELREEILDNFANIYDVRSDIVHEGKIHLTGKERSLLAELRLLCSWSLKAEIGALAGDLPRV